MWHRACLGKGDDLVNLTIIWACLAAGLTLMVSALSGWATGLTAGCLFTSGAATVFVLLRAYWDREIRQQCMRGFAELDIALGRPKGHGRGDVGRDDG